MADAHASRLATTWGSRTTRPWWVGEGSAVLADLSGFTRLTEALAGTGAEGVEVLHGALTTCFTALLDHSIELDGDVVGFAGDAALVWFDGRGHEERAARAAAAMPRDLASIPTSMTGRVKLRASVGVHSGEFLFVRTEHRDRSGLFLCGPEMSTLARLEAAAAPMQVQMSPATAAALPPTWRGESRPGAVVLERRNVRSARTVGRRAPGPSASTASAASAARAVGLAPDVPTGEHRVASIGFVLLPGTDAILATAGPDRLAERIQAVTEVVSSVGDDHAVTWLDVDVGDDCVKFLLAAGVPRAVDDDDARLVGVLRRIVDESPIPLRAGAQRGRVFSGLLGVRTRRTFTVLGDAVNVAARALGKAGDREVVAADGLGVERQRWVSSVAMGPQSLKNRVEPMEMWRVEAVGERPRTPLRRSASTAPLFRRDEWEHLARCWKLVGDDRGVGASVALVGDAGMGASELIAELVDHAGGAATVVVADRFRRQVPLAAVRALVASLAAGAGRDDEWDWLASFVPSLPPTLREWAADALSVVRGTVLPDLDPRTSARRARQVLVELVLAAAPRPWLLAVEDADQLDDASRQIVVDLSARATGERLMVVTSCAAGSTPMPGDTVRLEPLGEEAATAALLELAPHLRDDQISRVVAAGGGNPFVLAELLAHLGRDGLPDSLQRLGSVLIDALPPAARTLVLEASVFGTAVDPAAVAAVLGRTAVDLDDVQMAADAVLRAVDGPGWRFRHEAFRRVAYETLTFRRRRQLHGAIADLLRVRGTADAVLALHLQAAGREREAYPVAVAAASTAKATGALVEAAELFARAIAMARQADPTAVGPLAIELGETQVWMGDVGAATGAYATAARTLAEPIDHARLAHLRADLALSRHQFRPARRWIDRGVAVTAQLGDEVADVRVHLLLHDAVLLDLQGRHRAALAPAERALALAEQLGRPALVGLAHLQLLLIRFALQQPEALRDGADAVAIFTSIGDDRLLDRALCNSGLCAMYLGRWDEALELYQRARRHAERCGHATDAATMDLNVGFVRLRQRHFDEAERLARSSRRAMAAAHANVGVGYATLLLAMIASATGRFDDAATMLADARAGFIAMGTEPMVVDCDVVALELALRRGDLDAVARDALTIEPRLGVAEAEVQVSFARVLGAAEAALAGAADPDDAGSHRGISRLQHALARARELHLPYEQYLCLGALAEVTGSPETIDEHRALGRSLGIASR